MKEAPPYLSGNYAPVTEEVTTYELSTEGSIPAELTGWYVRNGPNPHDAASGHWFLGDGSVPGGGTANTAFLKVGSQGPNAVAASATATFWLETLQGQSEPTQLQYSQIVLLNFNTLSWPHVTVGTLTKAK